MHKHIFGFRCLEVVDDIHMHKLHWPASGHSDDILQPRNLKGASVWWDTDKKNAQETVKVQVVHLLGLR